MAVYLSILVGQHPTSARPVAVTGDPAVVEAAVNALLAKLDERPSGSETSSVKSEQAGRCGNGKTK